MTAPSPSPRAAHGVQEAQRHGVQAPSGHGEILPDCPAALLSPWATADPLLSHRLSYSPLETSRAAVLGQGPSGWEWGRDVRGTTQGSCLFLLRRNLSESDDDYDDVDM